MNHSLSTELRYFKEFCLILMKTPDVNNIAKIFKSMENGKVPLLTITDIPLFSRNVCKIFNVCGPSAHRLPAHMPQSFRFSLD